MDFNKTKTKSLTFWGTSIPVERWGFLNRENKKVRKNMSHIITIHPVKEMHRYGFETTQLYRAKVARYLGVDYIHLATSSQVRPDWEKK